MRKDVDWILDVEQGINRINFYLEGMTKDQFYEDHKTQDAVIRNFEIIGESVKNISQSLKNEYNDVPWQEWARMRDKLIHHYFGINLDIVWGVVQSDLSKLFDNIHKILHS